ncbi:hypothetical protein C0Q70_10228 [Pomacea canaliculata]|uniref:SH2 domain-containing protein n=1 Tax=Pomacea canaliculata TaxID=400727 RepID=A0A2T7PC15_POMCA|nr:hypothetical protein C0Q70_10228 [Pomacea canaliculata]
MVKNFQHDRGSILSYEQHSLPSRLVATVASQAKGMHASWFNTHDIAYLSTVDPAVEWPKEPEDVYEVMEEAADNVNGEEEYMEPDAPSPPDHACQTLSFCTSIQGQDTNNSNGSNYHQNLHKQGNLQEKIQKSCERRTFNTQSTSVSPPRQAKKISNTTPPSGGWLFNSAQATQGSSKKEDLSSYPWFHGNIKREDADHIFAREHMEGMFLIRKSERKADQPYTLVLWHHGRMWNLPVRLREDKKYAAGSKKADESQLVFMMAVIRGALGKDRERLVDFRVWRTDLKSVKIDGA